MVVESGVKALSALVQFGMRAWNNSSQPLCIDNCSGHGECLNGTCFCEIQFVGEECSSTNTSYFAAFATVFFLVALVCLVQLVVCIAAEWQRLKAPTFLRACRITTQKLLYFVVFLASLIRGAYFTSPTAFQEGWSRSLLSAYYPLLLSGSSLIVCFWAEIFHLRDLRWEHRQFLSKSFLAFATFNVISYSLLVAELLTAHFFRKTPEDDSFYSHIFNGCYAVLLFIVVIFFLIYGIEVFFKVRGGFLLDEGVTTRPIAEEARQLFNFDTKDTNVAKSVDTSQLHQSRLGLLSQALMLLFVVLFLCSETLGQFWKSKVPIYSRNWHNLVFRVLEIGTALWFPCVLWNCMSPEELWILNPKRLLKRKEYSVSQQATAGPSKQVVQSSNAETISANSEGSDCWICYDTQRTDAGPLIQPCLCKGDVRTVHHDCLRKWLMERASKSPGCMRCAVCNAEYRIRFGGRVGLARVLTSQRWAHTVSIASCLAACTLGACLVVQYADDTVAKAMVVGSALLAFYVCVRFFCQKQMDAYQRAKVSTLNIENNAVSTISESININAKATPDITAKTEPSPETSPNLKKEPTDNRL